MSKKNKLKRFADMASYPNVFEPSFGEVFGADYRLKGRWSVEVFGNDRPIVLELGCGKGEYTVALARLCPDKNFIGVDVKGARMWVGATDALHSGLSNVAFLRTRIEFIRSCFAEGEISEIWLTFPDPQPQQSRANKRLTSPRFLAAYRQIMCSVGTQTVGTQTAGTQTVGTQTVGCIHLKTDSQSLFDYTCRVVEHNRLPVQVCTADLYASDLPLPILAVQTYYEKMFMAKGFPIKYLRFGLPAEASLEDV